MSVTSSRSGILPLSAVVLAITLVGSCAPVDKATIIAGPGSSVGIIPEQAGVCPGNGEYVTIYMDDEDTNNNSAMSGWTGATSHRVTNHVNGTEFGFCRVNGELFKPLLRGMMVNFENSSYDPAKAPVGAYSYSVLKLGSDCPSMSKEYTKSIDNEDKNNANSSSGNIAPNNVNGDKGRTFLTFCLFTPSSSPGSMIDFPNLGTHYGVFAGRSSPPSQAPHYLYWLQTGAVHTDDEDKSTRNYMVHASSFTNDDHFAVSSSFGPDTENTDFSIARVK